MGNNIGTVSSQITEIFQRQVLPALKEGGINQDSFVGSEHTDQDVANDDGPFQVLRLTNEHDEELRIEFSAATSSRPARDRLACLDVYYGFAGSESPSIHFRRRTIGTWEACAIGMLSLVETHPMRALAHDGTRLHLSEGGVWSRLSDGEAFRSMVKLARTFDRPSS